MSNELQNEEFLLPGGIGSVKTPDGMQLEIKQIKSSGGAFTFTIGTNPEFDRDGQFSTSDPWCAAFLKAHSMNADNRFRIRKDWQAPIPDDPRQFRTEMVQPVEDAEFEIIEPKQLPDGQ